MPLTKMIRFLDENEVPYVRIIHAPSFTALETAASAHIPGKELAKTVMVKIDGEMAMAVLPASEKVDLYLLKMVTGSHNVELAAEKEFVDMFPGCDTGAMPPFGNLYDIGVFVSKTLTEDEEIAFNAGSHTELIRLPYAHFEKLVRPKVLEFATPASA